MPHQVDPVEGDWYESPQGQSFFVVAADEDDGIIEIQYHNGSIEEIDFDAWDDLEVVPIEQPEDWVGPYDDTEDENDCCPRDMHSDEWDESLEE